SVAKELQIPKSTVAKIAQSSKLEASDETTEPPKRRKGKPRIDHEARKRAVLDMHSQDLGTMEIARRLELAPSIVSRLKTELGLEPVRRPRSDIDGAKLWDDVDHVTASLEGMAMKVEDLAGKLDSTELAGREKEIKQCIKSLSEITRTVNQLR